MPNLFKNLLESRFFFTQDALDYVRDGEDVSTKNSAGNTLLHRLVTYNNGAILTHNLDAISILVKKYGADINCKNDIGKTPLDCLMDQHYWLTSDALFLVQLGADPSPNKQDYWGQPLIHQLVTYHKNGIQKHNKEAIGALVSHHKVDINCKNNKGKSPLQCLMDQRTWLTTDAFFLIHLGADPNTQDSLGQPLIHRLVTYHQTGIQEHNKEAISALVKTHKVDVNCKNSEGKTPLECLIGQYNFYAKDALFLVRLGANPNTTNYLGESLLHLLLKSKNDHSLYIKELITKYHLDVTKKDHLARTAFDAGIASNANSSNIMALIENSDTFISETKAYFKANNISKLNDWMTLAHNTSGYKNYDLQGKIRAISFKAFKESLENLSNSEKLEQLRWARTQPIFGDHRSHFFLARLGRTNTVIAIDQMIAAVQKEEMHEQHIGLKM